MALMVLHAPTSMLKGVCVLQGMRTVGPHVVAKFCEIIKLRNKLARNLGYEDFYDYKVSILWHYGIEHNQLILLQH